MFDDDWEYEGNYRYTLVHDEDAMNPLRSWDHGVQFTSLAFDYHSNRGSIDIDDLSNTLAGASEVSIPDPEYWRERMDDDDFRDIQRGEFGVSEDDIVSIIWSMDMDAAAWVFIETGSDYTINVLTRDDWDAYPDGIACISWSAWSAMQMISMDDPKLRTLASRRRAEDMITSTIEEYNKYAMGDVYGYIIEKYHGDEYDPRDDDDEAMWGEFDSTWGLIGEDYAVSEVESAVKRLVSQHKEGA